MLTPDEWQTIRHALSVARERFARDEETMRESAILKSDRLAEQFRKQIAEIDALLPKLDDL